MTRPKLLFLATEDWFVGSHFRPLLRRAAADGFEVVVAARDTGALAADEGVRVIAMPFARASLAPAALWAEVRAFNALLQAERPQIVHAIALKPIGLAVLADAARERAVVFALTGRGYLGARGGLRGLALEALAGGVRAALRRKNGFLLTENEADRAWVLDGADVSAERALIMPGAGVDPDAFQPAPEPASPPVIVGVAARLVRSKGVDLAVAALRRLRQQGVQIELRVAGAVDEDNPEHVTDDVLTGWRAEPGVTLLGRVSDINVFWAGAHIACLPSRGGEGLPRSLLEAAACGRPMVTTQTPGCADFVVNNETGLVVPRDDVDALADALSVLAKDPELRARMSLSARTRVLAGYTEAHAAAVASAAWRRSLTLATNT